ncbi:MAG: hypothetical protein JWO79_4912 [Actinomycetia bacterium]|jgi:hypothetical protein|nr:hypothetical protein [Actinomycetes bacterium]MDQ1653961.1 hypothetical protein [Cryptosporangiaceae bacterium]MDQ1655285.1 hypothetical protein [Cryptosporangiaceae bacterium]
MSAALAVALSGCVGGDGNQPPAVLPTAGGAPATPAPTLAPQARPVSGSAYCTEITHAIAARPAGGGDLDAASKKALTRYATALDRVVAVAPDTDRAFWTSTATLTRHTALGGLKGDAAIATKTLAQLPAMTANIKHRCGVDIG